MVAAGISAASSLEQAVSLICHSIVHREQNQLDAALACLNRALEFLPDFHACHVSRSEILLALKRYDEALADLDVVEQTGLASDEVAAIRAAILDAATQQFAERIADNPNDSAVYIQRANFFFAAREFPLALQDYERALQLAGCLDETTQFKRAFAHSELGQQTSALATYEELLGENPKHTLAWFNRGYVLEQMHRYREARESFAQAAKLNPGLAQAHLEQAHCYLAEGDFQHGWPLYEWRWHTPQLAQRRLSSAKPLWLGDLPLHDKTLLLWAEQGLGDTIQFARFVTRLADQAKQVILLAPAPLCDLLATLDSRVQVLAKQPNHLPEHDVHCPLMSLPLALNVGRADIRTQAPYLRANPALRTLWRERLGDSSAPRIGLAWAGRQQGLPNPSRDIPLDVLRPLFDGSVEFIALHDRIKDQEQSLVANWPSFRQFAAELTDMAQTAALIANLDLVITVDTAVAHLAGALGKPCWLLLRHSAEWRWQLDVERTPWYPTMRLFRQAEPGAWPGVIEAVRRELALTQLYPATH